MSQRPSPRSSAISAVHRPTPAKPDQPLDRRLVVERRDLALGERAARERPGEPVDRLRLRLREAKTAQLRRGLAGDRLRRGERDERLGLEPRAPSERLRELAADVVGEVEVDLLREDRRHEPLPERRHAGAAQSPEVPDGRADDGVRAEAAIEAGDRLRRAESDVHDPLRGRARRGRAGLRTGQRRLENSPRRRPDLRDREERAAPPDRQEAPVDRPVEPVDDLREARVALRRQRERVGALRDDREAGALTSHPG